MESDTAPRTELVRVFYKLDPKGGTEPIGRRIVEVPADAQQFELRDSRAHFIAYVPSTHLIVGASAVAVAKFSLGGGSTSTAFVAHLACIVG